MPKIYSFSKAFYEPKPETFRVKMYTIVSSNDIICNNNDVSCNNNYVICQLRYQGNGVDGNRVDKY